MYTATSVVMHMSDDMTLPECRRDCFQDLSGHDAGFLHQYGLIWSAKDICFFANVWQRSD